MSYSGGYKGGYKGGYQAGYSLISGGADIPTNTVTPAITGTAERGEELTCSTGTWEGTGSITYTYQWKRNGLDIASATSSTYTLVTADDNASIRCDVTATDDLGSRTVASNAVTALGAPINTASPAITGTEQVGEELSVSTGTWQGVATITYAYQWQRDGVNISGATSNTYTLIGLDYDTAIDCDVTATNSLDSTTQASNATGAIAGTAPVNTVTPTISGNTGLGDVLTGNSGTWAGVPVPHLSRQWKRNGADISGATGTTYTIVLADDNADITFEVTGTSAEGVVTAESSATTVDDFAPPVNTVAPAITGDTGLGDTLTTTNGTWTANPSISGYTYQWYRGASAISGATSSTYDIVQADDDASITCQVTATNASGSTTQASNAINVDDFTVPVITGVPTISGLAEVGQTLTATEASVSGNPTPTRTWQWQKDNVDISGATSSTYLIDVADENSTITVIQTETNALGSDDAESAATATITAPTGYASTRVINLNADNYTSGQTWADSSDSTYDMWLGANSGSADDPTGHVATSPAHFTMNNGDRFTLKGTATSFINSFHQGNADWWVAIAGRGISGGNEMFLGGGIANGDYVFRILQTSGSGLLIQARQGSTLGININAGGASKININDNAQGDFLLIISMERGVAANCYVNGNKYAFSGNDYTTTTSTVTNRDFSIFGSGDGALDYTGDRAYNFWAGTGGLTDSDAADIKSDMEADLGITF